VCGGVGLCVLWCLLQVALINEELIKTAGSLFCVRGFVE